VSIPSMQRIRGEGHGRPGYVCASPQCNASGGGHGRPGYVCASPQCNASGGAMAGQGMCVPYPAMQRIRGGPWPARVCARLTRQCNASGGAMAGPGMCVPYPAMQRIRGEGHGRPGYVCALPGNAMHPAGGCRPARAGVCPSRQCNELEGQD
jgi:hypothetical protein